jgi:predicted alpha/beta-fold hydrolase
VRSKIFGYNGSLSLYRAVSQNVFIPHVQTPTFALVAKDDPITKYRFVPIEDMERNPHFIVAVTESGGHCDFFYDTYDHSNNRQYTHFIPDLALEYFEKVQLFSQMQ